MTLRPLAIITIVSATGIITAWSFLSYLGARAKAAEAPLIDLSTTSTESGVDTTNTVSNFSIYSQNTYLYKSAQTGVSAANEFIDKGPEVTDSNVQGIFSGLLPSQSKRKSKRIIPSQFAANALLTRTKKDRGEHYYYRQSVSGVPVYKSNLAVHVKNNNEIYALDGSVILSSTVGNAKLSKKEAEDKVLDWAKSLYPDSASELKVYKSEKVIYNNRILGRDGDSLNHPALSVLIIINRKPIMPLNTFVISLEDGSILYTESLKKDILDRGIYVCLNGSTNCTLKRQEGDPVSNDADVDKTYQYLGDAYNFFFSAHQRDSYDNAGGLLDAFTHLTTQTQCPNAFWSSAPGNYFGICEGMSGQDVLVHEFTHAVTENTASLLTTDQSGALNEALSDVMALSVDTANWTIGETTSLGFVRDASNPSRDRSGAHPDRLFSTNYYCGASDDGGIHVNMTVITKAFYLMVTGGSFNGCTITPVARDKASNVFYRALTVYFTPTSNYKTAYNSLVQACSDLYVANSSTCNQIKAALQAVELDQQPSGTQKGPSCTNVARVQPACASGVTPTTGASPTPTSSVPTSTPIPGSTSTPTPTATPINNPTATPTQPGPTRTPTPTLIPQPTATPTTRPTPTLVITPSANDVIVRMKLKFQGILTQPHANQDVMTVRVGVRTRDTTAIVYRTGEFSSDAKGIWSGLVFFPALPPGSDYVLYVKGPKHIQKKICTANPYETFEGTYRCDDTQTITLKKGENSFDFSTIYLLVGDLPVQDEMANSYDLATIYKYLGRTDQEALDNADLNMDGIVDSQDFSLVIKALSFRFDD